MRTHFKVHFPHKFRSDVKNEFENEIMKYGIQIY